MGLYNRDYAQDEWDTGSNYDDGYGSPPRRTLGAGASDEWAIKFILAATVGLFLMGLFTTEIVRWLQLDLFGIERLQLWRIVTYGFVHPREDILGVAISMYVLWMFGKLVLPIYGSREFFAIYMTAVVLGGVFFASVAASLNVGAALLGASCGVIAITIITAMTYPDEQILFMFVIPMKFRTMALLMVGLLIFGTIASPAGIYAAGPSLLAAGFGYLYKKRRWTISAGWPSFSLPRFKKKTNVRLYAPEDSEPPSTTKSSAQAASDSHLDEQVDAILDKISREGEASLTDRERQILREASQKYKDR